MCDFKVNLLSSVTTKVQELNVVHIGAQPRAIYPSSFQPCHPEQPCHTLEQSALNCVQVDLYIISVENMTYIISVKYTWKVIDI